MVTLRPAEPADALAVAIVHVRSWQAAYRGLLPDHYLDALRPEDRVDRYHLGETDPDAPQTLLAVDAGEISGFVTTGPCRDDAEHAGEILALYVDPSRFGAGIGRRLLESGRAALCTRGHREAVLWVLAGNERAQHVYRVDDWEADGAQRNENVWGIAADVIRFRRPLP